MAPALLHVARGEHLRRHRGHPAQHHRGTRVRAAARVGGDTDFELSEEQELLRAGLRRLFERECEISRVRSIAYEGDGGDPELWRSLADAGWTATAVPEADGGAGLKFEDVALVIAESGRALVPLPLPTTLLAARSVARSAERSTPGALLSKIADGSLSVTLALNVAPQRAAAAATAAARDEDGWQLSGSCAFVPYGPTADVVLVAASMPSGGQGLFVMNTSEPGTHWNEIDVIDRTTRQYEVTLDNVRMEHGALLFDDADAPAEIDRLLDEWRAALSAESFGAGERLLELTVAYAKERVQFGRPIGANQAVKIRIAEMGAAVEQMRAAVYHAAVKIDADTEDRAVAVAMAKMTASTAGTFVATQAIHVHGGIGYTWEHDAHLYFKRIKSNELLLGEEPAHLERIADAVL